MQAKLIPDTRSGTPGADAVKTKGVLTWVAAHDALAAEVRLYDRLFTEAQPDAAGRDFKDCLNPTQQAGRAGLARTVAGRAPAPRPSSSSNATATSSPTACDHAAGAPVFNRITALKDSWAK